MVGKYKVITLCGSTRFKEAFLETQKRLTLEGNIVISVGLFGHSGDDEVWTESTKEMLDNMHREKISMADEVFVIDVGRYIGKSTRAEIEYAESLGKTIRYYSSSDIRLNTGRKHIEDCPFETFFEEWFYNCKTLEFTSKNGANRKFVEFIDRTDISSNISDCSRYEDLSIKNAVRKLLDEHAEDYFYENTDQGVFPVLIDGTIRYVMVEDITKHWSDHLWLRSRRPIIGFKAVSKDGGSVMHKPKDPLYKYIVGKEYHFCEDDMINDMKLGPFFTPSYRKAYSYWGKDCRMLLVAASGLIFVKNNWDDMAASSLRIIRELTNEDMEKIDIDSYEPRGFWTGECWSSYDDAFAVELSGRV